MKNLLAILMIGILFSETTFADCGGGNGSDDPPTPGCDGGNDNNGGNGGGGDNGRYDDGGIDLSGNTITGGSAIGEGGAADADASASAQSESEGGDASAIAEGSDVTFVSTRPDDIKIRNTPSVRAPNVHPTVSCFKGASGSISVPGFGGSLGAGRIDESCVQREMIRLASQMGMVDRALFMWCSQPTAIQHFGNRENCLAFDHENLQQVINDVHQKLLVCQEAGHRRQEKLVECLRK